ncbi:hypothetical protein AKO1_003745 [Acrasis kona]|uniref:Uncharacterized protein n=1 Tax=Acrasis kona TaxID=1008807 RepID=A0AAW2Z7V6_9EUKA
MQKCPTSLCNMGSVNHYDTLNQNNVTNTARLAQKIEHANQLHIESPHRYIKCTNLNAQNVPSFPYHPEPRKKCEHLLCFQSEINDIPVENLNYDRFSGAPEPYVYFKSLTEKRRDGNRVIFSLNDKVIKIIQAKLDHNVVQFYVCSNGLIVSSIYISNHTGTIRSLFGYQHKKMYAFCTRKAWVSSGFALMQSKFYGQTANFLLDFYGKTCLETPMKLFLNNVSERSRYIIPGEEKSSLQDLPAKHKEFDHTQTHQPKKELKKKIQTFMDDKSKMHLNINCADDNLPIDCQPTNVVFQSTVSIVFFSNICMITPGAPCFVVKNHQ